MVKKKRGPKKKTKRQPKRNLNFGPEISRLRFGFLGTIIGIAVIAFLIALIIPLFQKSVSFSPEEKLDVCFTTEKSKVCFESNIADSERERAEGLMNVESLAPNKGMIFLFDKPTKSGFWMKDTLISLDIIWIDNKGKVVYIKENAQPCKKGGSCPTYTSDVAASSVLEVNSGIVDLEGIKIGTEVNFYRL